MDFSLPTIFVVPNGTTLATAAGTQNLTPGQVGFFLNNATRTVAAAANTGASFFVAQGRTEKEGISHPKKSDFIEQKRLKEYYKFTPITTAQTQITQISNFTVKCGETLSLTVRAQSRWINTTYFNGLTQTFTVMAPCCDCGDDPCEALDPEALVDEFIAKINASRFKDYMTASKTGTGATTVLVLTGKAPQAIPNSTNPYNLDYGYDMITFGAWVYKGAATTMDAILSSRCYSVATVAVTRKASHIRGGANEVKLVERQGRAYQSIFKNTYTDSDMNPTHQSHVVDGLFYDEYLVEFYNPENPRTWDMAVDLDSRIRIFAVTGSAASTAIETLLTGVLGQAPNFDETQE